MRVLVLFILAAAAPSARTVVMDRAHLIPPAQWSYIEVPVRTAPAVVRAEYEVASGASHVRLAMVAHHNLHRFPTEDSQVMLAATPFDSSGRLRHTVRQPGILALVVDNTHSPRASAEVHVRIEAESAAAPVVLSHTRRAIVVALSLTLFAAIILGSARTLRKAQ